MDNYQATADALHAEACVSIVTIAMVAITRMRSLVGSSSVRGATLLGFRSLRTASLATQTVVLYSINVRGWFLLAYRLPVIRLLSTGK